MDHPGWMSCRGQWDCDEDLGSIRLITGRGLGTAVRTPPGISKQERRERAERQASLRAATCWVFVTSFCYTCPKLMTPSLDSLVESVSPTKERFRYVAGLVTLLTIWPLHCLRPHLPSSSFQVCACKAPVRNSNSDSPVTWHLTPSMQPQHCIYSFFCPDSISSVWLARKFLFWL